MKKSVLIFGLVAAAVSGGLVYWGLSHEEAGASKRNAVIQPQNTETIAYKWHWENIPATKPTSGVDGAKSAARGTSE